jgi:hypothetical protein
MKRMFSLGVMALVLVAGMTAPAHGYQFIWRSNVVYVSQSISNAVLAAALQRVEQAAERRELPRAVELLADALAISDADACQELAQTNHLGCPLSLHLKWLGLHYATVQQRYKLTPALAESYRLYLTECAAYPGSVRWGNCTAPLLQLIAYEGRHRRVPQGVALFQETLAALQPAERIYEMMLGKYMDFAQRHKEVALTDVQRWLALRKAASDKPDQELDLRFIKLNASRKQPVLTLAMAWLQNCAVSKPQDVQTVLDLARVDLSPERPDDLRAYYALLARVALMQPGNESSVRLIAYLLNEKKILEAIMPELRQP